MNDNIHNDEEEDKDEEDPEEPESQAVGRGVERNTLESVVSKDDIADAVSEAVSKNIVKLFSNDQEFRSEGDNLSKIIAKRTVELLKQKEATNKAIAEAEAFWNEDDVTGVIFCVVCRNHSVKKSCPSYLRKSRKNLFGIFAGRERDNS